MYNNIIIQITFPFLYTTFLIDDLDYNLTYSSLLLTNQPLPITLFLEDDDIYEDTESIILTLLQRNSSIQENQILAHETVVVTLEDNDSKCFTNTVPVHNSK